MVIMMLTMIGAGGNGASGIYTTPAISNKGMIISVIFYVFLLNYYFLYDYD
jgi:hypothetical protein